MPYPVLLVLALAGASYVVSAVLLVARRRPLVPAAALLVAGSLAVVAALFAAAGEADTSRAVLGTAGLVLVVALASYPVPRWRTAVDVLALATVATCAALYLVGRLAGPDTASWFDVQTLVPISVGALILHTWWRLEHSTGDERWALAWMATAAGAVVIVGGLAMFAVPVTAGAVTALLVSAALGPALYVGAVRPAVVDVRGVVVRFAELATAVLALYALFSTVVAFLTLLGDGRPPGLGVLGLVAALCALAFQPLRVLLRGVIDELLFGRRPDPLDAATRMAGEIGEDPASALEALRVALVLPFTALHVDGVEVGASGVRSPHTRRIPLVVGPEQVGELEVGLRAGDLVLPDADQQVLRLVAPLFAQTLHARTLAREIQASREETVGAVAEERRRLRRDLHDGLGPRLSGIAFTADAVRNKLRQDPDGAIVLLDRLRTETTAAIDDIRRLVYAMRPPAIDELGLVAAVRQQAEQLRTATGDPFEVTIDDEPLPALPAAVEVAAYRIAVEALTNAARHSGARAATLTLRLGDLSLDLEVRDAGRGGEWRAGVGISSMRERAAELGGDLVARAGLVRAVLPLRRPHATAG